MNACWVTGSVKGDLVIVPLPEAVGCGIMESTGHVSLWTDPVAEGQPQGHSHEAGAAGGLGIHGLGHRKGRSYRARMGVSRDRVEQGHHPLADGAEDKHRVEGHPVCV